MVSVISILASNATLGISIGAFAGVILAFSTQNIVGSVLAAIVILSTRMLRVGEESTINQTKGIIAEINLTNTVLSVGDNVVFVPNTMIISNMVQRKKRKYRQRIRYSWLVTANKTRYIFSLHGGQGTLHFMVPVCQSQCLSKSKTIFKKVICV